MSFKWQSCKTSTMNTVPITHFYVIRHGETEANAAQMMAGSMDSPLTETGIVQAQKAEKVLMTLSTPPKAIIHSHLSRARDTAMILNASLNAPIHEDPDFAEIHAGDWEGESYEITRPMFTSWVTPPNGEDPQDFFTRVKTAKIKALSDYNAPVMIVCHGGVMRALGEIHGVATPGKFRNAHLYEFVPSNDPNAVFPWNVWDYDLCEDSGTLIKNKSDLYS